MERIELSEQDLIEAVLAAQDQNTPTGGALTMRDLMRETGLSAKALRLRLWQLKDAGRLEVRRVNVPTLDERSQHVPAYKLKR